MTMVNTTKWREYYQARLDGGNNSVATIAALQALDEIDKLRAAEAIVRAVAADSPVVIDQWQNTYCAFCQNDTPLSVTVTDHASDCPWRLAVEWVAKEGS